MSADWISALANLMTGLAAVVAGWAGVRGLNAWRSEMVGRRKTELAEEVLAGFYRARDILTWARFPSSDDNDGGEDGRPGAGPDEELERGEIFAPVDRLTKESQVFSELQASRYRFMAYFGEEAAQPFEEIRAIHSEVIDSAHNLIRTYGQDQTGSEEARRNQWEAAIGWGEQRDGDTLRKRLDLAVKAIEQTCRPLIEERHKTRRNGLV